jgi:hypothetical protein
VTTLVLANLEDVEATETVGRETISVVSMGEVSDTMTEDSVGRLMIEDVSMYSVEIHCDTTE